MHYVLPQDMFFLVVQYALEPFLHKGTRGTSAQWMHSTALAETMMASRKFRYTDATTAPYELIVKIEKNYTDTVAYMHERKEGTLKRTIPSEGKKTMVARVELRDRTTKKPYLKPFTVTVQGQYDFVNPTSVNDAEFQKTSLLEYSLGQLDAEEVAKVDMQGPMFQELAKKIAEGLARAPKE